MKKFLAALVLLLVPASTMAANNPANVAHVPTIAAMRSLGAAASQYSGIVVDGYYTGAVGGGYFTYTFSVITPDGCVNFAPTSGTGTFVRHFPSGNQIDVTDCGAQSGVTSSANDTAIQNAFAYARANFAPDPQTLNPTSGQQAPCVTWAPGNYIYGGATITQAKGNVCISATPGTVSVTITSGSWFYINTDYVSNSFVSGIHWITNGPGIVHYTYTGVMVGGQHIYSHNIFTGYTVAAFATESSDTPEFHITYNQFYGASGANNFGFVLSGYVDNGEVGNNIFAIDAYHFKIGPKISGSVNIHDNSLLSNVSSNTKADIWFVPNSTDDSGGVNSGYATLLLHNRFGNEGLGASAPRILVAIEDTGSGSDHSTYQPSTTWQNAASNVYMSGLMIEDNRINGTGTCPGVGCEAAPVIKSYINNLQNLQWRNNVDDGSPYTYMVQFVGGTWSGSYTNNNWDIDLGPSTFIGGSYPFQLGISNAVNGMFNDRSGFMSWAPGVLLLPNGSDPAGYIPLAGVAGNADISLSAGVTSAVTPDTLGIGATGLGAEITVSGIGPSKFAYVLLGPVTPNLPAEFDLDLAQGTSNSVTSVTLALINSTDNTIAWQQPNVLLPAAWKTGRIRWPIPASANNATWQLRISADNYTAVTATDFRVGRVSIYHANQPMNNSPLYIIGANAGLWNGSHEIWSSPGLTIQRWWALAGKMRCKTGATIAASTPTADGDGVGCD